jgi:hypothetical protein
MRERSGVPPERMRLDVRIGHAQKGPPERAPCASIQNERTLSYRTCCSRAADKAEAVFIEAARAVPRS